MPIKGMTDRETAKKQYPRVGQLRKGEEKKSNKPGKDLDHFRFVSDDPEAIETFQEAYGDKPRRINIRFLAARVEEVFDTWMEEWGKGSLKHRCDSEFCLVWQDEDALFHTAGKCRCGVEHEPRPCPGGCDEVGRLKVFIPELRRAAFVEVVTGSKHDLVELVANLFQAEEEANFNGYDLRGAPFILTRVEREVSTPIDGKRVRTNKWLLHIEFAPWWASLQIEAAENRIRHMLENGGAVPQLEAPRVEMSAPTNGGGDDIERPETEVVDEEGAEVEGNGNGRKFYREDFVDRIRELMAEAEELGEPYIIDESILDEADIEELKKVGVGLRAHVDDLASSQAEAEAEQGELLTEDEILF